MQSVARKTTIDLLPEEVLCMIFDRLDVENVKIASLTCRRWHDIIFLSVYINRFKLEILFAWSPLTEECSKFSRIQMKTAIDALKHTKRCYRHMKLDIPHSCIDDYFEAFWKCLHPKAMENICSLELKLMSNTSKSAVLAIFEGIRLMPNLRSLSFGDCYEPNYAFPFVKSATVEHLKMDYRYNFPIPFDMPELQSFEGPSCTLDVPNQPLVYPKLKYFALTDGKHIIIDKRIHHQWAHVRMPELRSFRGPLNALAELDKIAQPLFTQLKRVSITEYPMQYEDKSILHRLPHVETLELILSSIDDWFLPAVCEAWPKLKHLFFIHRRFEIHPTTLRQLSKFVNLRQLVLKPVAIKDIVPLDFDFGLSHLTQLELLNLGSDVLEAHCLNRLPKSIKYLTVHMNSMNEEWVIDTIISCASQLQKLWLNYPEYPSVQVGKHTIMSLHRLEQLEVLVFESAKFSESVFLDMETPMPQMRELLFVSCEIDRNRLRECWKMFPNLKKIKFPWSVYSSYFSKHFQLP